MGASSGTGAGRFCRESRRGVTRSSAQALQQVVRWYFQEVYGRWEGPGTLPFYCDRRLVGHFAVAPEELGRGRPEALVQLFITLAMYQARRDVVIMAQQRALPPAAAAALVSPAKLGQAIRSSACEHLATADGFNSGCSVRRVGTRTTCTTHPNAPCHVKEASELLNRMGDMGKLPTSAWLHLVRERSLSEELGAAVVEVADRSMRADVLVERLARVYRVGRKLATMFVSAVAFPPLAPGLTPWFPEVEAAHLVVVDTNVAKALDALAPNALPPSYDARAGWLKEQASRIDLHTFRRDVPRHSPRLVQQALYAFGSRSNRLARADPCRLQDGPCDGCVPLLCPFAS